MDQKGNRSLDFVRIAVKPQDALLIMAAADERGDEWHLLGENPQPSRMVAKVRTLLMHVGGSDNTVEIHLNADGTWSASTAFITGPKL